MWMPTAPNGQIDSGGRVDNVESAPRAKLRVNLATGEIEIEGSEELVKDQLTSLASLLETIGGQRPPSEPKGESVIDEREEVDGGDGLPSTFGEWLNLAPKEATDTQKVLFS